MFKRQRNLLISLILGSFLFANPVNADMLGVTNDSGQLVSIDLTTGAATLIGILPTTMTEAVYNPSVSRFYAQGSNGSFVLFEINPKTGFPISSVPTTGAYNGLEFVGGTLYAAMISGPGSPSDLVTVDTATGTATLVGPTGFTSLTGLAYDITTGIMYGLIGGGAVDSGSLVTVNITTGVATMVGPTGFNKVGSIEFGQDGILYGASTWNDATQPNALVEINTSTGAATVIGPIGYSVSGLAGGVPIRNVPIPSSSSWSLLTLSIFLVYLGMTRLRRRFTY